MPPVSAGSGMPLKMGSSDAYTLLALLALWRPGVLYPGTSHRSRHRQLGSQTSGRAHARHVKSHLISKSGSPKDWDQSMANASLTISLPRGMKDFIEAQLREGTFSTPSEYVRSLIRSDQERVSRRALEAFIWGGFRGKALPKLDDEDWSAIQAFILQRTSSKRSNGRQKSTSLKGKR